MKINVEFANGFFPTHNFGQRVCVEIVGNLLCLFYSLHIFARFFIWHRRTGHTFTKEYMSTLIRLSFPHIYYKYALMQLSFPPAMY